jgi:hypothetical protein
MIVDIPNARYVKVANVDSGIVVSDVLNVLSFFPYMPFADVVRDYKHDYTAHS